MPALVKESFFKKLQHFKADYAPATLTQYVSERTGMNVVVVNQKGPKVNGYFALATEIFDDSGAPHTLEHLVFMGSKSYKYKGVLDKLATRAYSNTNAWTATDHTAYTLDTAGWEGFAQILPVYLEHVIVPTLTDEACYTEVHHVDGEGHDAGVVYSEMQGVQNSGPELMDLRARRLLYPENVGFRYETGGMMEALRVLSADRIRAFHKEMYQPKNLCLVIVGEVDQDNLLEILDQFEAGILDDIPAPDAPFKRPWIESPQAPPLQNSVIETVEFPEEDESAGEILVGFLGPNCNDTVQTAALNVLLTYLAGSSISVLENVMVEKEELASSISYYWDSRPSTVIWLQPTSVATEKLADVEKRLFELIKEVASKPLDMSYLTDCLNREKRQLKFQAESSGSFFATNVINDFLFGQRDGSTLKDLGTMQEYEVLASWTDGEWRDFMKKWLSDAHHVSILGVPSKKLSDKMKADETARVVAQKEKLGEEGLEKLAKKLEDAKAKNDAEIPTSILEKLPVPGVDSIHFIQTITARAGFARKLGTPENKIQKIVDAEKSVDEEAPLFVQFEHVPSNFVHGTVILGTSSIPVEHRPLLSLFMDNFFNTPIMQDGKRVEFEAVVTALEKDTISYSFADASRFSSPENLVISFQVEPEKYAAAIKWIKTMMFDSIFDEARLKASVTKMLADVPEAKRSGSSMVYAVDSMIHLDPESVVKARNTLVKGIYMKRIKKLIENDPKTVISWLEILRKTLFTVDNFHVLVIADVEKLSSVTAGGAKTAWNALIEGLQKPSKTLPLDKQWQRISEAGRKPGVLGTYIVPMPTVDSSFLLSSAKGPTSYLDPIIPALLVAIAFLDAVEGPLWSAVRGTGLAYGTGFSRDIDGGFIQFRVYRSPDAFKAFIASKNIVETYISGKATFEHHALEGAISSIVVGMADEQTTMSAAGRTSFVNQIIREVGTDFNNELMKKVRAIGVEEIKGAMKSVLLPAFLPGKANVVVTCATVMEEALKKNFETEGFKTQVQPLSFFQDDYGLKGDGEEDDDDEDAEDGDSGSGSGSDDGEDDDDDEEDTSRCIRWSDR